MPYLMELAFDNDRRLLRKNYLFEYKGVQFKLIQNNPKKWSDHLLTILPHDNEEEQQRVFSIASEYISALAWQNRARMTLRPSGGCGWSSDKRLSRARPRVRIFPNIPIGGQVNGYGISEIPKIETEQQRIALTHYREARASNNEFLSFLFYWQVLEVEGKNPN